jgi:predicted membrane protein
MNKQLVRIITGIGIIAIGIAALLGALDIVNFKDFFKDYWPLIIVAAGVLTFLGNPRQFIWPLLLVIWGTILQLHELDIVTVNVWQLIWPLIIIAVGLSIVFNRTHSNKNVNRKDLDNLSAIFSGTNTKNHSDNYKGGDITAVCGGIELDLRKAKIDKEALINVFAFWGGISITVPENWTVKIEAMPIAGGIESKAVAPTDKNAPVLYIHGDVIMSGVEIKN